MKRKIVLSALLMLLLVIILFHAYSRRSPISIGKNTLAPEDYTVIKKDGSELHRGRINQLLATLKAESLQQSVANLTNDSQQYFYPGAYSARKRAQNDLEILLSARRVTKVLQTIGRIGKHDQDTVSQSRVLFDQSFGRYQEIVDRVLTSYENPSAPKNTKSMMAATYALGTCMLGTALGGGTQELSRQLEQMDTFLKATQERIKTRETLFPNNFWTLTRDFMEPDKRFVLNVLIYSIMNSEQMLNERSKVHSMLKDFPRKKVPIVAWDSKTGYYDYVHVREGIPIDQDRIERTLTVYDWPDRLQTDPNKQEETIEILRGIARRDLGSVAHAAVRHLE